MKRYLILVLGLLVIMACEDNSQTNDDDIPICSDGEELIGDACFLECGANQTRDGNLNCVCADGFVLENEECVEDLMSQYDYSISFNNPNPRGGESFLVGGWKLEAFCANCVEKIDVQEAPNRKGLYALVGPDLTGQRETVVLHGLHPCFDELQITVTLEKGKTLNWTVARNDIQCTKDYEMRCAYITDEFLYEAAEHYLNTTPNVNSCCSQYPNTTQQVCLICPDFDADVCTTTEYVGLVQEECVCVGLDTEPRNYDVQETTPPPAESGYTRCNVDTTGNGDFNDLCICKDGTGSYLKECEYDLDPSEDPGYGDGCGAPCNDHCLCVTQ